MSKNNKIRRAGDDLPTYPKFTADGVLLRDKYGKIIPEDHFKRINTIRKASQDHTRATLLKAKTEKEKDYLSKIGTELENEAVKKYLKQVRSYDVRRKKRELRQLLSLVGALLFLVAALIYSTFIK